VYDGFFAVAFLLNVNVIGAARILCGAGFM